MRWNPAGPVIHLGRKVGEASAGRGPWMSAAMVALGAFALCALVELGFVLVTAAGAHEVPFDVMWDSDEGAVVGTVYATGWPVRPGDVIEAIEGEPIPAEGGHGRFRSLITDRRVFNATFVRASPGQAPAAQRTRYDAQVHLVRHPMWSRIGGVFWVFAMFAVAGIGMLVVRARGVDHSKGPFVALCLITGAGEALGLWSVMRDWRQPFVESWDPLSGLGGAVLGAAMTIWLFAFGFALRRFLASLAPEPGSAVQDRRPGRRRRIIVRLAVASLGLGLLGVAVLEVRSGAFIPWRVAVVTVLLTLLAFVLLGAIYLTARVPISVYRLAGAMRRAGGEDGQRIEAVLLGARAGAVLIGVLVVLFIGSIAVSEATVAARIGVSGAGMLDLLFGSLFELVGATAILLPFLGVFLAVTRSGLWQADAILKRATAWSGLSILFVLSWAGVEQLIELVVSGGVGELGSALVAGVLVTGLRGPASDRITKAVFPASRDLRGSLESLSTRIAGDHGLEELAGELMQTLAARDLAIVAMEDETYARLVWSHGRTPPVSLVAVTVLPALHEAPDVVVTTDASALLAVRLGQPGEVRGLVLVDPAQGTRFYDATERRLLVMTLNLLAPRLVTAARAKVTA